MTPIAAMAAVILALVGFAVLVLGGLALLRLLGLTCEPPDELRYQPAPPAPVVVADYARAQRSAAEQQARAVAHRQAFAAYRAHLLCVDVARRCATQAQATKQSEDAAAAARAALAATAASAATGAADAALQAGNGAAQQAAVAGPHATALAAQAEAETAAARLPGPDRRRFWLVLAVLLALWALAMLVLPLLLAASRP